MNDYDEEKDFRDWYYRSGRYTPGNGYYEIPEDTKIDPEWQVPYFRGLLSEWEKYSKLGDFERCKVLDDKMALVCRRTKDVNKLVSLARQEAG